MDPTELRMYLLVRGDLPDMTPGKLAAQAGHAFVALAEAARRSNPGTYQLYLESSNAKIVVKAKDDLALIRAHNERAERLNKEYP